MDRMTTLGREVADKHTVVLACSHEPVLANVERSRSSETRNSIVHLLLDKNRELLELLCRETPITLIENPFIVSNLKEQDDFLLSYAKQFAPSIHGNEVVAELCPNIRPWPAPEIELIEHFFDHDRIKETNDVNSAKNGLRSIVEQKDAKAIRNFYQLALQKKLSDLEEVLSKAHPESGHYRRLLAAKEEVQNLISSWERICDLVSPPTDHNLEAP